MAAAIDAYAVAARPVYILPPHIAAQGGWLAPVVPEGLRPRYLGSVVEVDQAFGASGGAMR